MINYGEEIAYWYLRLNGFFPLENFVVHRSKNVKHPSDIDIIALRLPFVFEEIGGQPDDWDKSFFEPFTPNIPIGIICEVKTGDFNFKDVFKSQNVSYAVGRFGFTPDFANIISSVYEKKLIIISSQFQIAKVLFSNKKELKNDRFFHFPISHLETFIQSRIRKYPKEKYNDRMFFPSDLFQYMVATNVSNKDRAKQKSREDSNNKEI